MREAARNSFCALHRQLTPVPGTLEPAERQQALTGAPVHWLRRSDRVVALSGLVASSLGTFEFSTRFVWVLPFRALIID
jgi:hypothetical protein